MESIGEIRITRAGGFTRITLPNAVNHDVSLLIENRIESALGRPDGHVVLDLSTIKSVDSLAIALILRIREFVIGLGRRSALSMFPRPA